MTFDEVDLQGDMLEELVIRQLERGDVGSRAREDRTHADWLVRAWRAAAGKEPEVAAALSEAVGSQFGRRGPRVDGMVLRFFLALPHAGGWERLKEAAERSLDRYPAGVPDPNPGAGDDTLRVNLLRVVLDRVDEYDVGEDLLDAARQEALAGRGGALLYSLFHLDGSWVNGHLEALLPHYPGSSAAFFRHLIGDGDTPEHALERLLPHADEAGRTALRDDIGYRYRKGEELREALLGRIGGKG